MGQYQIIKCQQCGTNLETEIPLEYCPVCKTYILDQFHISAPIGINLPKPIDE